MLDSSSKINMNDKLHVDKTYITHWSKLESRKEWLTNHLLEEGVNDYTWVENYDKNLWNVEDLKTEYPLVFGINPRGKYLNFSEVSLVLKHCWIIKDSFERKYDSILILEDDAVLEKGFVSKFNNYKSQLPPDWDICWVGSCCNLHSNTVPGVNVYEKNGPTGSRCTHSYAVSKSGVNKIIKSISSVNDAADHYYNSLIYELRLKNYWFEPSLASQNPMYETTIQDPNLWRAGQSL